MLARIRLDIRPWFEEYGETLNDATEFRHQIDRACAEIAAVEKVFVAFRGSHPSLALDLAHQIEEGRDLISAMHHRLDAILAHSSPDE